MNVTSIQLAKRILELLGDVTEGQSIDLAKLRNGAVLISKAETPGDHG
jgi:hypothetical protein